MLLVETIVRVAETAKTYGPPIALSSAHEKAGGRPAIPELQAVLGGMEALDRTTNNAWEVGAERIMGRLTFEASGDRLFSAGLTLDPEDEETARFQAAIQAMAARNVTRPNKTTSRRLYDELFNNGTDARWSMSPVWALSSTAGPPPGQPPLCR